MTSNYLQHRTLFSLQKQQQQQRKQPIKVKYSKSLLSVIDRKWKLVRLHYWNYILPFRGWIQWLFRHSSLSMVSSAIMLNSEGKIFEFLTFWNLGKWLVGIYEFIILPFLSYFHQIFWAVTGKKDSWKPFLCTMIGHHFWGPKPVTVLWFCPDSGQLFSWSMVLWLFRIML